MVDICLNLFSIYEYIIYSIINFVNIRYRYVIVSVIVHQTSLPPTIRWWCKCCHVRRCAINMFAGWFEVSHCDTTKLHEHNHGKLIKPRTGFIHIRTFS